MEEEIRWVYITHSDAFISHVLGRLLPQFRFSIPSQLLNPRGTRRLGQITEVELAVERDARQVNGWNLSACVGETGRDRRRGVYHSLRGSCTSSVGERGQANGTTKRAISRWDRRRAHPSKGTGGIDNTPWNTTRRDCCSGLGRSGSGVAWKGLESGSGRGGRASRRQRQQRRSGSVTSGWKGLQSYRRRASRKWLEGRGGIGNSGSPRNRQETSGIGSPGRGQESSRARCPWEWRQRRTARWKRGAGQRCERT